MRLFGSKIPSLTSDLIAHLRQTELVDVLPAKVSEVELDVESVLKEYLRTEKRLTEEAKDIAHSKGLDYSAHLKIRRQLAERRKFGLYEDSVGYIANQLIETLLHTQHVEEIFAEDNELRASIVPVLRKHMTDGTGIDQEVRRRMKHLEEGSRDWEISYQQTMERLRLLKGLQ
jgi:hypothetical protein